LIASAAESRARKDVVRAHLLTEPRHGGEIAVFRLIPGEAAEQRVPHMPMGFDQPGHDDHAGAVDPLPATLHILADRDDLTVPDMHRTIRDIAEHAVHRHHMGIDDGELAAWGKLRCADVAAPCLRQQGG